MSLAVSERVAPARTPVRPRTAALVGVVADLCLWELLVATRLRWSLRTFRRILGLGAGLAFVLAVGAAALVGSALRGLDDAVLTESVVAASALVVGYLALIHLARDVLNPVNPASPYDARHDTVKALDLPLRTVALVYAGLPRLALAVTGSGVLLALALSVREQIGLSGAQILELGLLPAVLCLAGAVGAAVVALGISSPGLPRPVTVVFLLGASAAIGAATGRTLGTLVLGDRLVGATTVMSGLGPGLGASVAALAAGALVLRRTHPGGTARRRTTRSASAPDETVRRLLVRGLARQIVSASSFPTIRNTVIGGACALACLLAARASGFTLVVPRDEGHTVVLGAMSMVVLAVTEALSRSVGPVRLGPTWRTLWELGVGGRALATTLLSVYLAPVAASAVVMTVIHASLTGGLSPLPALVHLTGLAAWVLAECLVPPLRNPDGSAMYNVLTGVATLLAMSPLVLADLWGSSFTLLIQLVYSILLIGGAWQCLSTYSLVLPSSSRP